VPVCESCGADFDPATLPATVTSSKILCRPCYDKRQAEKYAARAKTVASASAAGGPSPSGAAKLAPPLPSAASRMAAPSSPPKPAAPAPAPSNHAPAGEHSVGHHSAGHHSAGHQPGGHHHPASHHVPAHGTTPAPGAPAAPSHGETHAGESAHKPAVSKFSRHGPKKKADEPLDMKAALRAESEAVMDKTTKRGLFVALAFVLIAVGVVFVTWNAKATDDAKAKEYKKSLDDFLALVKSADVKTIEGANKVINLSDARRDLWPGTDIATEVNSARLAATNTLQREHDRQEFLDRLTSLEAQSKDIANKTAEELRKMRLNADTLSIEAQNIGPDAVTRINLVRSSLQTNIGTKVKEEAIAFADAQGKSDPRAALQKLGAAEDDVFSLWQTMYKEKNEQGKTLFDAYYRDLIARSDKLATEYFTPAVVEQTGWSDLLTGDRASEWELQKGAVKGSSAKIVGGVLVATGGGPDSKGRALYVVGDKEQWRDFVIDGEFTVESGTFTLAFRLGQNLDRNTEAIEIRTDEGKIAPGGTYAFTYQVIGSAVKLTWKDNVLDAQDRELMYSTPRHGAFGLVLEKGAKVTFKRLRIRELR
jgi:hypothetical protein